MTSRAARIAYRLDEAAEAVGVSPMTIRRAIAATKPDAFPPPLRAKNVGTDRKRSYRISHVDLVAWFDSLKDA